MAQRILTTILLINFSCFGGVYQLANRDGLPLGRTYDGVRAALPYATYTNTTTWLTGQGTETNLYDFSPEHDDVVYVDSPFLKLNGNSDSIIFKDVATSNVWDISLYTKLNAAPHNDSLVTEGTNDGHVSETALVIDILDDYTIRGAYRDADTTYATTSSAMQSTLEAGCSIRYLNYGETQFLLVDGAFVAGSTNTTAKRTDATDIFVGKRHGGRYYADVNIGSLKVSAPPTVKVVFEFGQSNAQGNAGGYGTLSPALQGDQAHLFVHDITGTPNSIRPLAPVSSTVWGCEITAGSTITAGSENPVCFIKVASSGSSLFEDWQPGGAQYVWAVDTVNEVLAQFDIDGIAYTVEELWWIQGENDANYTNALAYEANWDTFIDGFEVAISNVIPRKRINILNPALNKPYIDEVVSAQESIASRDGYYPIVMSGYDLRVDGLHYSSTGLQNIGIYLGGEFLADTATIPNSYDLYAPMQEGVWTNLHDVSGNENGGEVVTANETALWAETYDDSSYFAEHGGSKVLSCDPVGSYADLGVVPNDTCNWSGTVIVTDTSVTCFWGSRTSAGTDRFYFGFSGGVWTAHFGGGKSSEAVAVTLGKHTFELYGVSGVGGYLKIDGNQVADSSDATPWTGTNPLYVGGRNYGASFSDYSGMLFIDSVIVCSGTTTMHNAASAYGTTLPDSIGTNDATLVNTEFVYIPALLDGADDAEGLGITNPSGVVHNGGPYSISNSVMGAVTYANLITNAVYNATVNTNGAVMEVYIEN